MHIRRKHIERITITGAREDVEKADAYCAKHGYRITHRGPRRVSLVEADVTRFMIIAEREMTNEPA